MKDLVFCHGCGKEHHRTVAKCPHCGVSRLRSKRYKSKVAAGVLGLLIGGLGVHRFYLGQWWGVFYLLFFWTFIPGFVAFIEGIVILCSDQDRWDEKYNDGIAGGEGSAGTAVVIAVVVVFVGIAMIGILAAIAIPAYQTYTLRAKVANAVMLANVAAAQVSGYVAEKRSVPASLRAAGFTTSLPPHIKRMEVDESGAVVVTMSGSAFDDQAFAVRPRNDNFELPWRCESAGIAKRYLPKECQHSDP